MSFFIKTALSALLTVLAVPGLVIEPGPISEILYISGLSAIWGFDLLDGADETGDN